VISLDKTPRFYLIIELAVEVTLGVVARVLLQLIPLLLLLRRLPLALLLLLLLPVPVLLLTSIVVARRRRLLLLGILLLRLSGGPLLRILGLRRLLLPALKFISNGQLTNCDV
jgi:hypothetical protein